MELSIKKIDNGYLLEYYSSSQIGYQTLYFETKSEMFNFIDQILE